MVAESPANLECRVIDVIEVEGAGTRIVLGEVLMIHVREDALDGTRVDSDVIQAVGRLAGQLLCHHPGPVRARSARLSGLTCSRWRSGWDRG